MTSAQTIPLKHLASINECSLADDTHPDKEIRYIDIGAVGRGKLINKPETLHFRDAPSRARRIVREGDTIVSTVRTYLRAVWPVTGDVENLIVSTGFAVITPKLAEPQYLSWWVTADPFVEEVAARSVGVSYPAINASELGQLPVRFPTLAEQRAIADYLDTETARIDTLISKKRRLIELLAEHRTALITQTVTRGLDPSPRLRPSGIDWLGDIPEHWDVSQLRRFVKSVKTGSTPVSTALKKVVGDDIAWLSPGDIGSVLQMKQPSRTLAKIAVDNGLVPVFPAESTLIVGIGATTGRVGHTSKLSTGNQQLTCIVGNDRVFPRFLSWQLWAHAKEIRAIVPYTTLPILNNEFLLSLPFAAPSLREQRAITDYLDTESARVDALSSRLKTVIKLLEEYRTALITAAVTGDLAVPGLATETPTVRLISP